jgi:hypothetical protein
VTPAIGASTVAGRIAVLPIKKRDGKIAGIGAVIGKRMLAKHLLCNFSAPGVSIASGVPLVAENRPQRIHKLDDQKQGNDRKEAIQPIKLAGEQRHYEGMEGRKAEKRVSREQRRKTSKLLLARKPNFLKRAATCR